MRKQTRWRLYGRSVPFTGTNAAEVRAWVHEHPDAPEDESWFLTKGQSASSGGQAWRYVKAGANWGDASAAVYDPAGETWMPVYEGDCIERRNGVHVPVRRRHRRR